MHDPLVRPEPTQTGIICNLVRHPAELRHQLLDRPAHERLRKHAKCLANQPVAVTESKRQSDAASVSSGSQFGHGHGVYRVRVQRVAARAWWQWKAGIHRLDRTN